MFATINGTHLYYETVGAGPAILTMHGGLGLDHTTLRPWHDELARDHRVIYFDHRGNGRSARSDSSIDHETWHADAAALLDHLDEKSAVVLGHSYGAWLALGFALLLSPTCSRARPLQPVLCVRLRLVRDRQAQDSRCHSRRNLVT